MRRFLVAGAAAAVFTGAVVAAVVVDNEPERTVVAAGDPVGLLNQSYAQFQASAPYRSWKRQNPGEAARVEAFWANGGAVPSTPSLFGTGLSLEKQAQIAVTPTPPPPPPPPPPPLPPPPPPPGPGTILLQPGANVQAAWASAAPGAIIELATGVWAPITLTASTRPAGSAPVTVRSQTRHGAKVNGGLAVSGAKNFVIEGLAVSSFSLAGAQDGILRFIDQGYTTRPAGVTAPNNGFSMQGPTCRISVEDSDFGPYNVGHMGSHDWATGIFPSSSDNFIRPGSCGPIVFTRDNWHDLLRNPDGSHTEGIAIWGADNVTIQDSTMGPCAVYCISMDRWPPGSGTAGEVANSAKQIKILRNRISGNINYHMGVFTVNGLLVEGNTFARGFSTGPVADSPWSANLTYKNNTGDFGGTCSVSTVTCIGVNG